MLTKYIPKRYAQALLKHVVAVSLFIPYIYSKTNNVWYQDFILANAFAILTMITIITSWKLEFKKNGIFLAGLGILLLAYNIVSTYMNYKYHHWYGEQINTTICFLFFMLLLMVKDSHALFDNTFLRSVIHMMVTSNVLAIGYRLITDQNRILFMNNYVRLDKYEEVYAPQYCWVYMHKCQYAFILVLCIAFCVVYRKLFRNIFTYLLSLGVLLFALYLSDTYTSMAACTLIFIGLFMDYLWKAKWWKKLIAAVGLGIPGMVACVHLYNKIGAERDLLSLGSRKYIWAASWETITNNPNGMLDFVIGGDMYSTFVKELGHKLYVFNAHNVFLNQMLRFSIPVGGIYLALIVMLFLFSLKRKPCFLTLGIWGALCIPWCMDYSMTCAETTIFLLTIYCLFFINTNISVKQNTN